MHDHLKTAVITGGTKGIGAAIARVFYHSGYAVVVCGRVDNGLAKRLGRGAFLVKGNVCKPSQMKALMAQAHQLTGRVDVLVNCAGFSQWRAVENISEKFLDEMLAVNLKGAFWACQAARPYLKPGASIVNCASLAGKRGSANNSAYCAAKFGLIGLTQSLAKEWGTKGIRVNAVCPVYVPTVGVLRALEEKASPAQGKNVLTYLRNFSSGQSALGRLPTADEVAGLCLFLASSQAAAITGQSINVDCGVMCQ